MFIVALLLAAISLPIPSSSLMVTRLTTSGSLETDSWPTFHHDAGRSGFANQSAPSSPSVLWKFDVSVGVWSSPIVANGTVYFTSYDGYLYALNQSVGNLLWKVQIGPTSSTPTAYGDSVYVSGAMGIFRISASTGNVVWRNGLVSDSDTLVINDEIFVSGGKRIYSLYASNGSIGWMYSSNFTVSGPAYANGAIYVGTGTNIQAPIIALNARLGTLIWAQNASFPGASGGVAVSGGIVYSGGSIALNSTTGRIIWTGLASATGTPAIAYGRLFIAYADEIVALSRSNGSFLWDFRMNGFGVTRSTPAVAGGFVFAGGGVVGDFPDPTLYCLNASNGHLVWRLPIPPDEANSSPSVANGTIYIGSGSVNRKNGTLYAITSAKTTSTSLVQTILILTSLGLGSGAIVTVAIMRWRKRRIQSLRPKIPRTKSS